MMHSLIPLLDYCQVIEAPSDSASVPDGAALSAYQYFENVRNFLDSIEGMGIPAFEASDLEQVSSLALLLRPCRDVFTNYLVHVYSFVKKE